MHLTQQCAHPIHKHTCRQHAHTNNLTMPPYSETVKQGLHSPGTVQLTLFHIIEYNYISTGRTFAFYEL